MFLPNNFHSSQMMWKIFHTGKVYFAIGTFTNLFHKLILLFYLIFLSQYEQLFPYHIVFIHSLEKYSEKTNYSVKNPEIVEMVNNISKDISYNSPTVILHSRQKIMIE